MDSGDQTTRRTVLGAMASILPSAALLPLISWAEDEVPSAWPYDRATPVGVLRIALRLPDGHTVPLAAKVSVRVQDKWVDLPRGASELLYAQEVKTGQSYDIRMVAPGYMTIERSVRVDGRLVAVPVYLVPDGWSYYFAGEVEVPVEPRPRLAGVAMATRIASATDLENLLTEAKEAGFNRVTRDPDTGADLDDVNGSVLYFVPKEPDVFIFSFERQGDGRYPDRVSADPLLKLRKVFARQNARIGAPTMLGQGRVKIVDNQYLIRLPQRGTQSDAQRFAETVGARVLKETGPNGGFWLIEFDDPQNLGRHLDIIARAVKRGKLASGEPNLVFQLQLHSRTEPKPSDTDPPQDSACLSSPDKDPCEQRQENLVRQRVKDAWCYIAANFGNDRRYGWSGIYVGSLDVGITFDSASNTSSHPDVDPQSVGYCGVVVNQGTYGPCTGMPTDGDHGMGTYGIISAKADNDYGVTGIAPNATHIALQFSSMWDPVLLSETLLRLGGVDPNPPSARPATANTPAAARLMPTADIISCSQGLDGVPLPELVGEALVTLTCTGRGGRGTVLIFSAGNDAMYLATPDQLATHPNTIGVANTEMRNNKEARQMRPPQQGLAKYGSNFSDWIELCANGEDAPSLMVDPSAVGNVQCDSQVTKGVFLHGGTSAAASMVAGAAALILTVKPDLNWQQVREILCRSAEKIDCNNCDADGKWTWLGNGPAPSTSCQNACQQLSSGLGWFSKWYGFGRLDAYEAVKLAGATAPVTLSC